MKNQSGNAFLFVLIGITLFAALSYAISQAGNTRDSIDEEQAEIAAAEIINYAAAIKNTYTKLKTVGRYDQVQLSLNGANDSGTCYSGTTTYTCRTIGLFSPEANLFIPDIEPYADPTTNYEIAWISGRALIGADDVGTSQPDVVIILRDIKPEICEAINYRIHDDPSIPDFVVGSDAAGLTEVFLEYDGDITSAFTTAGESLVYPFKSGCSKIGSFTLFSIILEAN